MSTGQEVATIEEKTLAHWWNNKDYCEQVKKYVGKDLSPQEFIFYLAVARGYGIQDPLRRTLIPTVFSKNDPDKRTLVFIGTRELWLSIAERNPNYQSHQVIPIFSGNPPDIDFQAGTVKFSKPYNPFAEKEELGLLVGAVAIVYLSNSQKPFIAIARLEDYRKTGKGSEVWDAHTIAMIEKCALIKALRNGLPKKEDLPPIYDQDEFSIIDVVATTVSTKTLPPPIKRQEKHNIAAPYPQQKQSDELENMREMLAEKAKAMYAPDEFKGILENLFPGKQLTIKTMTKKEDLDVLLSFLKSQEPPVEGE